MTRKKPSLLLKLPRELRDEIYIWLFASITVTFGKRNLRSIILKTMKLAPKTLAILHTCRQINAEARSLWLRHVLFSFESAEAMVDKLRSLPQISISQIRNIQAVGNPLVTAEVVVDQRGLKYYGILPALEFLPGLRLDKFTVHAPMPPATAYCALDTMIKEGRGWKEFHFITPDSTMLSFSITHMLFRASVQRSPQPGTWNEIIRQRDGIDSGASVIIYRSTQPYAPGTVTNPDTRQIFEQRVPLQGDLEDFGIAEDRELLTRDEIGKEVLVIVKRGRGANVSV